MALFCDHDWQPRSGYDSGSFCSKCYKFTDKEFGVIVQQSSPKVVAEDEDDTPCWTNTLWS